MRKKVKFLIAPTSDSMQSYQHRIPIGVSCEAIITEATVTLNVAIQVVDRSPLQTLSVTCPIGDADIAAISELRNLNPDEKQWETKCLPEDPRSLDMAIPETGCNIVRNRIGFRVFICDYIDECIISAVLYLDNSPGYVGMELYGGWRVSILGAD